MDTIKNKKPSVAFEKQKLSQFKVDLRPPKPSEDSRSEFRIVIGLQIKSPPSLLKNKSFGGRRWSRRLSNGFKFKFTKHLCLLGLRPIITNKINLNII